VLKGRVKGIYLRGETYWFAKQVNGRRSFISLETNDYIAAIQRAREIMESPEAERFLKHKYETNRYSKMSAQSKRSCLSMFADSVKDTLPSNVTTSHCKAFYNAAKMRVAPSTAESYMFTLRSFFNWCVMENLCRRNPVVQVQLDRIDRKGRTQFADLELAQRLIENAPNDDLRYVLFCGFHVGMRKLEIVEAVPEWFNLARRTVMQRMQARSAPAVELKRSDLILLMWIEVVQAD